jgi:predicted lipid carrier protein YhbT
MHLVQTKDIKLNWVLVVVDRRINVVQERQFEVHVASQEGLDGEVGAF